MDNLGTALCDIERNAVVKWYPDGSTEITCSRHLIFRERGWEEQRKKLRGSGSTDEDDNLKRAVRRARSRLRDYARSNPDFFYFVTCTLDKNEIDRYDIGEVTRRLRTWLDNRVRRKGLKYILVPEHHKDGAIHFHGFINRALPVVDSGTLTNGGRPRKPRTKKEREKMLADGWHIVYNLPDWGYGFTTAIELYGEREKAIGYVCKYIGKEMKRGKRPEKIGGRWYYSGGALALPDTTAHMFDFEKFLADYPGNAWSMSGAGEPDIVRIFEKGGEGHDLDRWLL
jgi:hypothetical protein